MNLSTYRKIQKFLLASFCASVALLTMTTFLIDGPMGSADANGSVNTTANVKPTQPVNATPTNMFTPANNTSVNPTPTVNTNAANTSTATNTSPPAEPGGDGLMIIGVVTFLTSITSLLGFISTTVLAWRKEKRESETIRVDNEKKELELEKLRWELEKMKAEERESKPKRPRKPKKTE